MSRPGSNPAILSDLERQRDSSGYGSESGDMLRELVKNKELMKEVAAIGDALAKAMLEVRELLGAF